MSPCFLNFIINEKKKCLRIFSCVYKPFWILWWKHWFLKILFAFYFLPLLLPFFGSITINLLRKGKRCSSESTRDQSGRGDELGSKSVKRMSNGPNYGPNNCQLQEKKIRKIKQENHNQGFFLRISTDRGQERSRVSNRHQN